MSEQELQIAVCQFIRAQYPKAIFTTESSGLRLTIGQARKLRKQRSGKGFPDLMIFEPKGDYNGMFIELKREGEMVFRKDGSVRSDVHLQEQWEMLQRLRTRGYYACFAIGFDQAVSQIKRYMEL